MNEILLTINKKINPLELIFCEADENYTRLYFADRVEIVPVTLKKIDDMLVSFPFFRIHKSYLVNINFIIDRTARNKLEMRNNHYVEISRRKLGKFQKMAKNTQNSKLYFRVARA